MPESQRSLGNLARGGEDKAVLNRCMVEKVHIKEDRARKISLHLATKTAVQELLVCPRG